MVFGDGQSKVALTLRSCMYYMRSLFVSAQQRVVCADLLRIRPNRSHWFV